MFESFTDKADLTPYTHEPARIDLNAVNTPTAYGAERSMKMDFSEYDQIDDFELNEILWRADQGQGRPAAPGRPPGDRLPAGRATSSAVSQPSDPQTLDLAWDSFRGLS